MIELELSIQLLTGLATAVYVFVVLGTGSVGPAAATAGMVGLTPLLSWIIVPEFLGFADVGLPVAVRRPAVLLVGVAILLRYLPLRTSRFSETGLRVAGISAAVLFWGGVALSSANWIVALGAALPAIAGAMAVTRPAGASSDGAQPQAPGRTDSEQ